MRRIVVVSVGLLLFVGCGGKGGKGTLSGTIKYKDQPVNGAILQLYPAAGAGEPLPIPVGQDGTFRSTGVPPGDYKVVVEGSAGSAGPPVENMTPEQRAKWKDKIDKLKEAPTIQFPDKYKTKEKTDLTCTVGKGETKEDFVLKD